MILRLFLEFAATLGGVLFGFAGDRYFARQDAKKDARAVLTSVKVDMEKNARQLEAIVNQPASTISATVYDYVDVDPSFWRAIPVEKLYAIHITDSKV